MKTNLPKKQPTIENWTENKTNSPLVKYNLGSLLSTQERYMIEHDQEVFKNFDLEKNLPDYENGVVVKSRLRKNLDYWKKYRCQSLVLDITSSGYKIPFIEEPPCVKLKTTN